ncbi:MAG: tetratricopeptide repeat protein, partial [Leptospiraceae bacterium]|nr:tetratricopeptide repeat protein [Leptospiraceae bacterium]
MRRIILFILLLILLFTSFGFVSWSIVRIKLKELKYYVAKDQLLNLQFSSELLRDKFKQLMLYKDDYKKEIALNIQDSTVLNASKDDINIELDYADHTGLMIVNGVRRLSFKDSLRFVEDKEIVLKLQYAFFFERAHKYKQAIKKYEELLKNIDNKKSEEYAFTLLHLGFCYALLENTDFALQKLTETENDFPGTHYSQSARIIKELLLRGKEKKAEIAKSTVSGAEKIRRLYKNGFYKAVLTEYSKLRPEEKTYALDYIKGRSLEETSNIPQAIKEYIRLVNQTEDPEVARQANRRLVMISNIYQKNDTLANFSKQKAEELKDDEMVKNVEKGKNLIVAPKILKKLEKAVEKGDVKAEFVEELKEDKVVEEKKIETEIAEIIEAPEIKKVIETVAPPKEVEVKKR